MTVVRRMRCSAIAKKHIPEMPLYEPPRDRSRRMEPISKNRPFKSAENVLQSSSTENAEPA
jgi:hypothetical protein